MVRYAALEPWRVRQGKAEISSIAVCKPNDEVIQISNTGPGWREDVRRLLRDLRGEAVYAHNAVFDVAWLIATLEPEKCKRIPVEVKEIQWRDTMLLGKWLINGQKAEDLDFSYSLANMCDVFLVGHPKLHEFLEMKSAKVVPGENEEYWLERGSLDAVMTRALAEKLQSMVPPEQRIGMLTEFKCVVPIANSWVNGIRVAVDDIEKVESAIRARMDEATDKLGVNGEVINSGKQLGELLFTNWGLKPLTMNKTGPSTKRDDLMWIHYGLMRHNSPLAEKMELVMDFKRNSTLMSKYVKALMEALSHTRDGYIYGIPRIFGTYTGRFTYSNSTFPQGQCKTSIALHQLPRAKSTKIANVAEIVKMIRGLLLPPPGFGLIENDASGQESRLMAIRSQDPTMLKVFRDDLNFHSVTASAIVGMDYYEFQEEYKVQEESEGFGYYIEQRQLGKLTNLSCNFRIGGRALAEKAFTTYDTFMTEEMGRFLVNTFKRQYSGVPKYWDNVIEFAKRTGYTETFGKRRYKIHKWGGRDSWISESSAINVPIQGSGADHKEIAISTLYNEFPDIFFALDLHDGIFSYAPIDLLDELKQRVLSCLNNIDYEKYWNIKVPIPLTFEAGSGTSFKEVK
jgi:DNA polymerase I-like protein with 3'-5' exonuclease and polymerase domains